MNIPWNYQRHVLLQGLRGTNLSKFLDKSGKIFSALIIGLVWIRSAPFQELIGN